MFRLFSDAENFLTKQDKDFIQEAIDGIEQETYYIKKELIENEELLEHYQKNLQYVSPTIPRIESAIRQLKIALQAHQDRSISLKKLIQGEKITIAEQAHLLKMDDFQNTIVSNPRVLMNNTLMDEKKTSYTNAL